MILAGAIETLKKATFVQLEVSVIQYNKGAACWHEIDAFLRKNGFYFYDSNDYNRNEVAFHTKAIGQFDVLYINPTSTYLPKWLVDNNVEFCGSSGGFENERENETTMALQTSTDGMSVSMIIFCVFSAFVGGYIVGKLDIKSKGLVKSN